MAKIIIALLILFNLSSFAQRKYLDRKEIDRLTDSIKTEGNALYRSEWASWYGTDIFLEKCANIKPRSAGYFSYETADKLINIFYSKSQVPEMVASITFNKNFNKDAYVLDTVSRKLNQTEVRYLQLRLAGIERIRYDTTIKAYPNTSLNPVPLITNGEMKVYVLTAPKENGVVLYGNDYLMRVDADYSVKSLERIHNSLIKANAGVKGDTANNITGHFHNHLPGKEKFITATDICTTLLYEKFTTWQNFSVVSKDYVTAWDCSNDKFVVLTMEAWKRIESDQSSRKKKN